MSDSIADRRHPASPRRLLEARQQGHVPRSGSLASAVLLLTTAGLVSWSGLQLVTDTANYLRSSLSAGVAISAESLDPAETLEQAGMAIIALSGTSVTAVFAAAIAIEVAQVGCVLAWTRLSPDPAREFERGAARITHGLRPSYWLGELLRFGWPLGGLLLLCRANLNDIAGLSIASPAASVSATHQLLTSLLWNCGLLLLISGGVHYAIVRWKHAASLRMTDDELRDEQRQNRRRRPNANVRWEAPVAPIDR
ncbi:MAG: EscU/YscU/HrcU family type III secretion system export apparatus switch protein [Planctomycetaceae bacterium]